MSTDFRSKRVRLVLSVCVTVMSLQFAVSGAVAAPKLGDLRRSIARFLTDSILDALGNAIILEPTDGAVEFSQVECFRGSEPADCPGWGKFMVNQSGLASATGRDEGYVHAFIKNRLVVFNLFSGIPGSVEIEQSGDGSTISTYIDIGENAQVRQQNNLEVVAPAINAVVLHTEHPLTPVRLRLIRSLLRRRLFRRRLIREFPLGTSALNPGGDLDETDISPLFFGPPPQSGLPPFDPEQRLATDFCIFQDGVVPIEAANNQCVAESFANGLKSLEGRDPLITLPPTHFHKKGLRGELPPALKSIVGTLGEFQDRDVTDRCDGKGLNKLQYFKGLFGYATSFLGPNSLEVIHQAKNKTYTAFGETSTRQGLVPTFEWACDRLAEGYSVVAVWGYYKITCFNPECTVFDTKRTGGHAVRVTGCCVIGGVPRLRYVSDFDQAHDNAVCPDEGDPPDTFDEWLADTDPPFNLLNFGGSESRNWDFTVAFRRRLPTP
ncbi:MAG: hypothetical protein ACE5JS_12535 [Nitrospinota bacterium]